MTNEPINYRGYRLRVAHKGTSVECTQIWHTGELIALVPTLEKAKTTIDEWMDAR